jgi:hypothetical protein
VEEIQPDNFFVGADQIMTMEEMAKKVESELILTGLPIHFRGNSMNTASKKAAGVVVYFDPSCDSSGGVFVTWKLPPGFLQALITAGQGSGVAAAGGAALRVMLDALEKLLVAFGWGTDRQHVGVHESSIKVLPKPRTLFTSTQIASAVEKASTTRSSTGR